MTRIVLLALKLSGLTLLLTPLPFGIAEQETAMTDDARVERVARAIWQASGGLGDGSPDQRVHGRYIRMAEAAIAAAEPPGWKLVPVKPTEAMLIAGSDNTDTNANRREVRLSWSAMLNAAPLQPPPGADNE
jgi:hypothetical protein